VVDHVHEYIAAISDHAAAVLKQCERDGLRIEVVMQLAEALKEHCRMLRKTYDMEACV
jgi:hypothetical protein